MKVKAKDKPKALKLPKLPQRYDDTAYMFSSARIRAMENRMLGAESCERLLGARSSSEILTMLGEYGCRPVKKPDSEMPDREATLMSVLSDSFSEIEEMLPDPLAVRFLQYKYDCSNIKALLKCRARGIAPDGMLFPTGSVPEESITAAAESGDYSVLPTHMAAASSEAAEVFLKTGDPQQIDLILDRACFADMLDAAKKSGVPFSERLVRTNIDLTNAVMCVRVLRMNAGEAGRALLTDAFVDGGTLDREFWFSCFDSGERELWSRLAGTDYSAFAAGCGVDTSLSGIERASDRFVMSVLREVKWMPFGAELSVAYLFALEYALKNVRIIMAGKDAGLDDKVIRERLRDMYV